MAIGVRQEPANVPATQMDKRIVYMLMLLLVTFFWGITFPVVKLAIEYTSPDAFLALRFLFATAMMAVLVRKGGGFLNRTNVITGMIAGFLLFLGYYFQTVGLEYTSAAASGIITGAYVVFIPLVSLLYLKTRVSRIDVVASVLAFGGLLVMSLDSGGGRNGLLGDALTLLCAVAYAVQIAYVSKHSRNLNSYTFTFYQLAGVTIFSAVTIPISPGGIGVINDYVIFAVIFTAIFGSIFGYYISTIALIYVEPTTAGIIYLGEPVFAAIAAVMLAHEVLGAGVILGGVVMVLAMLMTTLDKYRGARKMHESQG